MKIILKGGTVLDIDLSKSGVFINSSKIGTISLSDNCSPWTVKNNVDEFMIPLICIERIEL